MEEQVAGSNNEGVTPEKSDEEKEKYPLILNGIYFKVISNEEDGKKISAQCLKCTGRKKIIHGSLIATSNFVTHLKRVHNEFIAEFEEAKQKLASEKSRKKPTVQSLLTNPVPVLFPPTQKLVTDYGFSNKPTQAKVDELIQTYIVDSMIPLRTVEQSSFINLIKGMCPDSEVMTRKRLKRRITEDDNKLRNDTIKRLAKASYLCLTTDGWSAKSRSFLGATCHWISENLDRESVALSCRRFKGSHTYDKIAEILLEIFAKFHISQDKILYIVTDNGSNFVKAFRVFGKPDDSTDEDDDDEFYDDESESETTTQNAESYFEFHDVESVLNEPNSNAENVIMLPKHIRCAAHTLSLIATTDAEEAVGTEYKRILRSSMGKCQSLWNCNSRPKSAEIIQDKCGKLLVTPCKTRWNSLYDSIRRLLDPDVKPNLDSICVSLKLPKFTQKELDFLDEYKKLTAPVAQGLDILQGDNFIGALLPTLLTIKSKLEAFSSDATIQIAKPLQKAMLNGLSRRFENHLNLSTEVKDFIMASVSHPFFKLKWVPSDKYEYAKNMFLDEVCNMALEQGGGPETEICQTQLNDYFVFPSQSVEVQNSDASFKNKIQLECLQYFEEPATILRTLHQYPSVKKLFVKSNTPIPSSAPVERLFSFGGLILGAKRRKMTDKTFEQLLLGKCSKKMK